MPPRQRHSAAEAAQKEIRYNIPGLHFDETLSWRAGRPIPVADLLSRLQKLSGELRNYDLDEVDSRSFTTLAHDLANPNLLGHKDKGVRAWTVACIVDVLRICAPDAPFQVSQLKDIFTVTINSILPALADPSNAYNAQHVYILTALAESQSILLVADVPNHENLIVSLFTTAFDIISGSGNNTSGFEVSKSVEYHLKNLLAAVVDEVVLPQEVTDIIISQFLRVDTRHAQEHRGKGKKRGAEDAKQATLLLKEYPPAYNMAKSLCTTCPEKMTIQITQYFGAIIVDATAATSITAPPKPAHHRRTSDLDGSEDEHGGFNDLRKAHRLLRELWRACPDVLLNVIPQIEAEFSADSPALRRLATETIGDIAAGIGIAGLPATVPLDPAAYPLPSLEQPEEPSQTPNPLLTPASPKPFANVHASAYSAFLGRRVDRAPSVREAWAIAASRILLTSAGGIGLDEQELQDLLSGFAQILRDIDERVRLVAIQSVAVFSYHDVLNTLAADGGLSKPETVLSTMVERVTDRKHDVREAAIELLARLWGVASSDIENGLETVKAAVGDIADRLFRAFYTNDPHVQTVLDKALYESLLPLSFPPIKMMSRTESQKSRTKDKDIDSVESTASDPDAIRARRILTLVRSLQPKSRAVFFNLQNRQVQISKAMTVFLQTCEEYNGGVVENKEDEGTLKDRLTRFIDSLSKPFPEPAEVAADLWKFVKQHNRRWYQLIRFAIGPEHDYRTVTKAIKELGKRIREGPPSSQSLLDTLFPILYRCALLVYNRSHVPAIMEISRTDQNGLGEVAHEVLKEISARHPEVLKSHIQALCKELEDNAPTANKPEETGAADTLKACAGFARRYPTDVPAERKFITALTHFALFSRSPRAAKHAVSIIIMVSDKKEMYAKDILLRALKDCEPGMSHFLARLATISQLCLLAPAVADLHSDAIRDLAISKILHKNRSSKSKDDPNAWDEIPDEESKSKELALKVFVNRCRAHDEKSEGDEFEESAKEVFGYLTALIKNEGEIAPQKDTPPAQKNRLRLVAAHFILKLCGHSRKCEEFINPSTFISIAMIMINPPNPVRTGFVNCLKKYIGQNRIAHRWFTPLFLLAFEPDIELRTSTVTWIRARIQFFTRQQLQAKTTERRPPQNVLESVFARLLSLLAHHPDYPSADSEDFDGELLDFSKYIMFYLFSVATEDNLSLIFHIAQRVKGARDGIQGTEEASERLYVLSDLSQAVIRNYADMMPGHAKGVNLLQTWPGNVTLPRSLFKALPSHEAAQEIAEKNYLPEDVATGLEKLVRTYVKELKNAAHPPKRAAAGEKKRKSDALGLDDGDEHGETRKKPIKKARKTTVAIRKTPKPKRKSSETASPEMPSRKSARRSNAVSYAEADSDDDDAEMERVDQLASRAKSTKNKRPTVTHVEEEDNDDEGVSEGDDGNSKSEDQKGDQSDASEAQDNDGTDNDEDMSEGEDAGDDVEMTEEAASEQESSPSPTKAQSKVGATKTRNRGGGKQKASTPNGKGSAAKRTGKHEQPAVRATRQTRSTKA
ncbi:Sister chromatid cohesion protein pds5 [Exophiala dermatitidis]|uniref:Sister chromatid cohesion protein pds5 n=1 Tax=Exophiala dermatitidis TaxID=5970 RepID=A0AAN6EWZ7_EXODE|nr:Sister chromatid cohesion protein pds5 [Exophiala dermatitidis]KAJ4524326.1 Sister chromatid cohesion protein pds5 [Exophiala dermatitidis]KAJ4525401.1 Sister chromatid cohesion protein pds5 [Exophiala dermatitidis]KAJ4536716.1 Sister chromatid cohesion protein pds5 [Exophiala dermatitidis]KAJ4555681.1 Sister chromatid cohesion protein pds5 [Exophiala dermatitidis]